MLTKQISFDLLFHTDTNHDRADERRNNACPDFYNAGVHPCPQQGQPAIVVRGGYVQPDGQPDGNAFLGQVMPPSRPPVLNAMNNRIADLNGIFNGMFWSCDEFPPAM